MTDFLQVVGGVMLICIPVSLIMSLAYTGERYHGNVKALLYFWFVSYVAVLLLIAVALAGLVGVAMLMGAFR